MDGFLFLYPNTEPGIEVNALCSICCYETENGKHQRETSNQNGLKMSATLVQYNM